MAMGQWCRERRSIGCSRRECKFKLSTVSGHGRVAGDSSAPRRGPVSVESPAGASAFGRRWPNQLGLGPCGVVHTRGRTSRQVSATNVPRVFAAAIASSLVAKTQISSSTGMAPLSQSIENKVGSLVRASFAHSELGRDGSQVVRSPPPSAASCRKSARNANAIMEIPLASASKSVSAMKVFMAGLPFRKEIDHALERIASIEKHLGIETAA
jgi:hypothetical protein